MATEGLARPEKIEEGVISFARNILEDGEVSMSRSDRVAVAEWDQMVAKGQIFEDPEMPPWPC